METVVITFICAVAGVQTIKIVAALILAWHQYDREHPQEQRPHIEAKEGGIPPVKE